MTPAEIANMAAEEVMRSIEFERCIIKARLADVIERVILKGATTPHAHPMLQTVTIAGRLPSVGTMTIGGVPAQPHTSPGFSGGSTTGGQTSGQQSGSWGSILDRPPIIDDRC